MAKPDEAHILDALSAGGFAMPKPTFYKQDPRGPEYGRFAATFTCGGPTLCITVTKERMKEHTGTNAELTPFYTMHFHTAADFQAWAADCT